MIHFIGHVGVFDTEYWIRKHIFPGGWIPSLAAGDRVHGAKRTRGSRRGKPAPALRAHARRVGRALRRQLGCDPRPRSGRFDEYFRRKWRTYLWSCAEMFRSPNGSTHLFQVTVSQRQCPRLLSNEPRASLSFLSMTPYEAEKARLLDELAAARAQGGADHRPREADARISFAIARSAQAAARRSVRTSMPY